MSAILKDEEFVAVEAAVKAGIAPQPVEAAFNEELAKALKDDAEYQRVKKEHDRHVSNWFCHYNGSARVYCMVGYSLAEAMKPLLARPTR